MQVFQAAPVDDDEDGPVARLAELKVTTKTKKDKDTDKDKDKDKDKDWPDWPSPKQQLPRLINGQTFDLGCSFSDF